MVIPKSRAEFQEYLNFLINQSKSFEKLQGLQAMILGNNKNNLDFWVVYNDQDGLKYYEKSDWCMYISGNMLSLDEYQNVIVWFQRYIQSVIYTAYQFSIVLISFTKLS